VKEVDGHPLTASERLYCAGEALFLFASSPLHISYSVAQLATFLLKPIQLNQFRIYRTKDKPVGFVSWAFLSAEAAEAYSTDRRELRADDWISGDRLWIIDFIAPFGHAHAMHRDLRCNMFPNHRAMSVRRHPQGHILKIVEHQGINVARGRAS